MNAVFSIKEAINKANLKDELIKSMDEELKVRGIGFDKIETQAIRTITTAKSNIYQELFNYLIMDFDIKQISKIVFDPTLNEFKIINPNEFTDFGEERVYEKEVKLIKKMVPLEDRERYLM